MSRILLSTFKYSHLKLSYASVATQKKVLLKSILPCASCSIAKRNYSSPVAEVQDRLGSERGQNSPAARTRLRSRENVDQRINRLDQYVKRLGRVSLREVESTLKAIEKAGSISATQSLMLIRSCGGLLVEEKPKIRTQLAHRIWKLLEHFDVKLDISHYNALLRVYLENEYSFNPSDTLRAIEDSGLEVNRVTCQRLINRYCQMGDIGNATRILEHMRKKGMPINESVFNALISGHSEVNDMESAEGILSVMKESGLEPSAETYTLLMCGFIKNGNLEKVDEIFKLCESKEVMFADKDYFDLIYAYAMHGYEDEIDKVLGRIRRSAAYNPDAMNFSFKLLTANKPEIAYKILKSMLRTSRPDGSLLPVGNFFIAHLVRSNAPLDLILKYSHDLIKENLNPRPLEIAVENALRFQKIELGLNLLKEAKDKDVFPIREHYFWPLLVSLGKKNDIAGMCDLLVSMDRDFNVPASRETIQNYVIPYMMGNDPDVNKILLNLKSCNIPTPMSAGFVVLRLLELSQFKRAIAVSNEYVVNYPRSATQKALLNCFLRTSDVDSFIAILQDLISHLVWLNNRETESEVEYFKQDHRDFAGEIVGLAVEKLLEKNRVNVAQELIQKVVEAGIGLNESRVQFIQTLVKDVIPAEIANSLEKLSSDEFAIPPPREKSPKFLINSLNTKALERLYEMSSAKVDGPTMNLKRSLFLSYGKEKDFVKMLELKKELEAAGFILNIPMLVYCIDAYLHNGDLEEALKIYQKLCDDDPKFHLNPRKTLALVDSLIEHEQYDKAVEMLKKGIEFSEVDDTVSYSEGKKLAFRVLNKLAEKGNVEKTKELFDLFVGAKLVKPNSYLLSPIIRAHLEREDYDEAMKEFENCVRTYGVAPLKHELARHFIEKEDAERLQKLVDLNSQVHGEANSLSDLMFAFLESGRIKQAHKILETPGFRLRPERLRFICTSFSNKEDAENTINLLTITKHNTLIDRTIIYDALLSIYGKQNEPQKSLSLWIEIQEEGLQPSDSFLILLASILQKNNLEVPFVVPDKKARTQSMKTASQRETSSTPDGKLQFSKNFDAASTSKHNFSYFIKKLLLEKRYDEAKKQLMNRYEKTNTLAHQPVMKSLLQEAIKEGDVEFFNFLDSRLTDSLKSSLSFDNNKFRAYASAGRTDEYVSSLEEKLAAIQSKEQLEIFLSKYPRSAMVELMIKHPEYIPRVEASAQKCAEIDETCTMQDILFSYYLIQKNYEKADQIWNTYLQEVDKLTVTPVLSYVYRNLDPQLGQKLLSYCEKRPNLGQLSNIYRAMIDVLVRMNEVEQAKKCFEEALTKISIDKLRMNTLKSLQQACHENNIDFSHKIPVRKETPSKSKPNEASDSDSD